MSFERAIPHFELSLLGRPFYLIKGLRHDLFSTSCTKKREIWRILAIRHTSALGRFARRGSAADGEMISVRCESLASLMRDHGHQRIDLLKMDIEGAEFEVLDSMMESGIQVSQIAVEYHNAVMAGVPRGRTIHSLWKLWKKGYRLIHKDGSNHTLLHRSQF